MCIYIYIHTHTYILVYCVVLYCIVLCYILTSYSTGPRSARAIGRNAKGGAWLDCLPGIFFNTVPLLSLYFPLLSPISTLYFPLLFFTLPDLSPRAGVPPPGPAPWIMARRGPPGEAPKEATTVVIIMMMIIELIVG